MESTRPRTQLRPALFEAGGPRRSENQLDAPPVAEQQTLTPLARDDLPGVLAYGDVVVLQETEEEPGKEVAFDGRGRPQLAESLSGGFARLDGLCEDMSEWLVTRELAFVSPRRHLKQAR